MQSAFTPSKQMKFSRNFNELLNVAEPIEEAEANNEVEDSVEPQGKSEVEQ